MDIYQQLTRHYRDSSQPLLRTAQGDSWTLERLEKLTTDMQATLQAINVKSGDRVLVQVDKSPHSVALYLCCLKFGYVLVPLNTAYTQDELDYFVSDAQPAVVVLDHGKEATHFSVPVLYLDINNDQARGHKTKGEGGLTMAQATIATETDAEWHETPWEAPSGNSPATLIYTSGTTGRSKGAVLSRDNLLANAVCLADRWGFTQDDILLHALPVFHVHGLFIALNTALISGATVLFLPRFDVAEVLEALPLATVMMGVPTFYVRLLANPQFGREECRNIRLFVSGSAPLDPIVFKRFAAVTGHPILERYGMSETNIIASNPLDGERCAGSVGFALDHTSIRITDANGKSLAPNQVGAVQVKGPGVFAGYWRRADLSETEFTTDGYFRTGDLGSLDEHGRLTLAGRSKDLIISGGLNVYPAEIEQIINAAPGVAESAVVAAPDPDFGERVEAFVVSDGSNDALIGFLEQKVKLELANFKRPKVFHLIDALPRNTMGKIQKNALRERLAARR